MMNLFLSPFNTPHGTVPFHKINLAVLREAILLGIEEEEKEIDAIILSLKLLTSRIRFLPWNNLVRHLTGLGPF